MLCHINIEPVNVNVVKELYIAIYPGCALDLYFHELTLYSALKYMHNTWICINTHSNLHTITT